MWEGRGSGSATASSPSRPRVSCRASAGRCAGGSCTERHPVGTAALRITDVLQRLSVAPAPIRSIRPFLARGVLAIPPIRHGLRRRVSGLSIAYPPPNGNRAHPWQGRQAPDAALATEHLYETMRTGKFVLVERSNGPLPTDIVAWADHLTTSTLPCPNGSSRVGSRSTENYQAGEANVGGVPQERRERASPCEAVRCARRGGIRARRAHRDVVRTAAP